MATLARRFALARFAISAVFAIAVSSASSGCAPWDQLQILPFGDPSEDGSLRSTIIIVSSADPQSAPRDATVDFAGQSADLEGFDKGCGISLTGNGRATLQVEVTAPPEALEVERVELAAHIGFETRTATITNLAHGIVVTDAESGDVVDSPLPRGRRLIFESDREGLKFLDIDGIGVQLEDEDGDDVTRVVTTIPNGVDSLLVFTSADAVFECDGFATCFGGDIPRSQPFAVAP